MRKIALALSGAILTAIPAFAQDDTSQPPLSVKPVQTNAPIQKSSTSNSVTTVHSTFAGHPTALIPGFPGFQFEAFDRVFGSPNGNWILGATSDDPSTTNDEVIVVNGVGVLKEGDPAVWDAPNVVGTIDTGLQINDAGDWAFATNVAPSSVNDDFVIKVTAGPVFNIVAQESLPTASIPTSTYDDTIDSIVLLANGTVGVQADGIDGGTITTTTDEILELGNVLIAQELVTIPTGQAGGATETADNFDFEDFWADATGANVLWQGDLTGSTSSDGVVVVNNNVVLQENSIIPGSGFANPIDLSGIVGVSMDPAGNWYARGNNDIDEMDWVVRSGAVVAAVGQPITPGSTELWDDGDFSDCFFAHVGNSVGDFVVAGVTDNASTHNGVVVWNGVQVVLREGDPVDLDNNGAFDDGVYFNTFGNDDFYLSDANELYVVATVRDVSEFTGTSGTTVGNVVVRVNISACAGGPIVDYGSGCPGSGVNNPAMTALGCPTPGGALTLAITDGIPSSTAILFIGIAPTNVALAGGCTLLTSPVAQLVLPLDASGGLTIPTVIPPGTPTSTAYLQAFNLDAGTTWGYRATDGVSISIQ